MLILSRRANQKVLFPALGITVQVLRIVGRQIKLGIDAPAGIVVLRDEVAERNPEVAYNKRWPSHKDVSEGLLLRLHAATVELNALQQELEAGRSDDAEVFIFRVFRELQSMDEELTNHHGDNIPAICPIARTALLVDDNQNETQLLASYLRSRRFEVTTVSNGADAMDFLAHNERPDFVLLDMLMPKFDGRWTISESRGMPRYAGLRVFGVSGMDPEEYGVEVGPQGLDGWFRKPLNPESLVLKMFSDSETRLETTMN